MQANSVRFRPNHDLSQVPPRFGRKRGIFVLVISGHARDDFSKDAQLEPKLRIG
jgi:hypothetical protein